MKTQKKAQTFEFLDEGKGQLEKDERDGDELIQEVN